MPLRKLNKSILNNQKHLKYRTKKGEELRDVIIIIVNLCKSSAEEELNVFGTDRAGKGRLTASVRTAGDHTLRPVS